MIRRSKCSAMLTRLLVAHAAAVLSVQKLILTYQGPHVLHGVQMGEEGKTGSINCLYYLLVHLAQASTDEGAHS